MCFERKIGKALDMIFISMTQLETEVDEFLMRFYEGRLKNLTQGEFREWVTRVPNVCSIEILSTI